jgi:hypothetical protein
MQAHKVCEMSRLPHFLGNWLTDGGEIAALSVGRPLLNSTDIPGSHFSEADLNGNGSGDPAVCSISASTNYATACPNKCLELQMNHSSPVCI